MSGRPRSRSNSTLASRSARLCRQRIEWGAAVKIEDRSLGVKGVHNLFYQRSVFGHKGCGTESNLHQRPHSTLSTMLGERGQEASCRGAGRECDPCRSAAYFMTAHDLVDDLGRAYREGRLDRLMKVYLHQRCWLFIRWNNCHWTIWARQSSFSS